MAGQIFATNSLGGFMYSDQLSDRLRYAVQPLVKFRQFADVKDAFGKHRGQTFTWDVYLDIANQGGTIVETNTMPESNYTIVQATTTVTEMGQSIPYSGKLEALAQHSVRQPLMRSLRNDAKKTFDIQAHAQWDTSLLSVVENGTATVALTTTGTATATNSRAYTNLHAKAIIDVMKERNIPPYVQDDYYAIAWPTTFRTFKNNLESIHQYTPEGLRLIMNGEIGRYESTRYVEQTHVPKGGAVDSTTWNATTNTADAWDNALSDWIFFFGEDTVGEGIVIPEEVRAKIPTDYGRSKGVAWYYLGGLGITHTNAAQSRIVKWDSAS